MTGDKFVGQIYSTVSIEMNVEMHIFTFSIELKVFIFIEKEYLQSKLGNPGPLTISFHSVRELLLHLEHHITYIKSIDDQENRIAFKIGVAALKVWYKLK